MLEPILQLPFNKNDIIKAMSDNSPIKIFKGINGQAELYSNKVIIKRKGIMSKLTQGFFLPDKTLYLNQITGIKLKKASLVTNGFIEFILSGNLEFKKGLLAQTHSENSIFFRITVFNTKAINEEAEDFKNSIEEMINNTSNNVNPTSSADELAKFKKLLDERVITKEEFEKKKKQLLSL